jgi:hypothetical protein
VNFLSEQTRYPVSKLMMMSVLVSPLVAFGFKLVIYVFIEICNVIIGFLYHLMIQLGQVSSNVGC